MKAIIDPELCTGCELCVSTCPDLFQMEGDIAKVIVEVIPEGAIDSARQAAEDCPAVAIKLEE